LLRSQLDRLSRKRKLSDAQTAVSKNGNASGSQFRLQYGQGKEQHIGVVWSPQDVRFPEEDE
jgi:hypothetical protein